MAAPGVSDRGDVFGFVCINRAGGRAPVSRVFQIIVIDPLFLPGYLTLPVEPPIICLEILKSGIHFILNLKLYRTRLHYVQLFHFSPT